MNWWPTRIDTGPGEGLGRFSPRRTRRRALPQLEALEGRLALSSFSKMPGFGRAPLLVSEAQRPSQVIPVGDFAEEASDLRARLGGAVTQPLAWEGGPPLALWRALFPTAARVVVCPGERGF